MIAVDLFGIRIVPLAFLGRHVGMLKTLVTDEEKAMKFTCIPLGQLAII